MKKYLLLSLVTLLLIGTSCKKDEMPNIFAGTTWKATIDMKTAVLPDEYKDSQYYYTLKFLSKTDFILVMEDSNGVTVNEEWKGKYEVSNDGIQIHFTHENGSDSFKYNPKNKEIYGGYFGVNFIKQI